MATERGEDGTVESTSRALEEHCSLLSGSFGLELRRTSEENALLAKFVNDYKMSVKNLEGKVNEDELNGMELLRELKRPKKGKNV